MVDLPTFEANYTVVADDSRISFSTTQEGDGFSGEFTEFDAVIYFDMEAPETSQVWITIPISGFDGGSTDRNSNVSSTIWFDTKRFPDAVFKSTAIRADGDGYIANGTVSMKGVTRPISFPFTLDQTGEQTVMSSQFPINRTRWNIGQDPWNTEDYVGLNVMMDIRVVATQMSVTNP